MSRVSRNSPSPSAAQGSSSPSSSAARASGSRSSPASAAGAPRRSPGLLRLPVHVSDVSDKNLLKTALIENIQREDLNPIEEALAYKRLGEDSALTQEEIAAAVGKDRTTVANHIRLAAAP